MCMKTPPLQRYSRSREKAQSASREVRDLHLPPGSVLLISTIWTSLHPFSKLFSSECTIEPLGMMYKAAVYLEDVKHASMTRRHGPAAMIGGFVPLAGNALLSLTRRSRKLLSCC